MRKIYLFFGPPGSGKGTQSDMLGERLDLPVISAGELLRAEQNSGSRLGKKLGVLMDKGELVSDRLVYKLVKKRSQQPDTQSGFILDGYPRRPQQLKHVRRLFKRRDHILAIQVQVGDKEVKQRIGGRRVCDCGAAYHLKYNPPTRKGICDDCGKKIYIRHDDKSEILMKRLRDHKGRNTGILKFFADQSKLIEVNGEQSIEDVFKEIIKKI